MAVMLADTDDTDRQDEGLSEEPQDLQALPDDAFHDLIPRNRDDSGNRKGNSYSFKIPTVDASPIEETPLLKAVEVIRKEDPALAAVLEHTYNHKLLTAGRISRDVRATEERWLIHHNASAIEENNHTDRRISDLEKEREQATAKHREALDSANEALGEAHKLAAERVAIAGGEYDPSNPTAQSVLDPGPNHMEVAAAELNLPWTPGDAGFLLPVWLSWALSIVVGTMMGLSYGLMAHLLDPDTLPRQLPWDLFFLVVGSAAAIFGRAGIKYAHRQASERSYRGLPWQHRIAILLAALLVDLAILVVDSFVQMQGLLAAARLHDAVSSLSGSPSGQTNHALYFMAAIIVTIGYVVSAAWEGYLAGRQGILTNLVHKQCREKADKRRQEPVVAESLAALAQVKAQRRQVEDLEFRISKAAAPFNDKIQGLESRRPQVLDRLPEYSMQRIQDALDNFCGAQEEFNAALEAALRKCQDPPQAPAPIPQQPGPLARFLSRIFQRRDAQRAGPKSVKRSRKCDISERPAQTRKH